MEYVDPSIHDLGIRESAHALFALDQPILQIHRKRELWSFTSSQRWIAIHKLANGPVRPARILDPAARSYLRVDHSPGLMRGILTRLLTEGNRETAVTPLVRLLPQLALQIILHGTEPEYGQWLSVLPCFLLRMYMNVI
jgi:hypothetical protein